MELYQIRQFLAFARCGSVTQAAEETHTSQPAVSRSMKRLEEELGVPLFTRTKNTIALNEYGILAADLARKIDADVEAMRTELSERYQNEKSLAIASCAPTPVQILKSIADRVFPHVTVTIETKGMAEILADLDRGDVQVGILTEAADGGTYVCKKFTSEQLLFSAPKNHPLAGKKSISFRNIDGETMLLMRDIGFWRELVVRLIPNTRFVVQSERKDFLTLVDTSILPSFTSNLVIEREGVPSGRVPIPISDDEAHVIFYAVCRKSDFGRLKPLFDAM